MDTLRLPLLRAESEVGCGDQTGTGDGKCRSSNPCPVVAECRANEAACRWRAIPMHAAESPDDSCVADALARPRRRAGECDPRHARFPRWLSGKPLSVPVHQLVVGRYHQNLFRIARFLGRQPSIGQDRGGLSHR
jgi:hypothetical protein